MNEQKINGKYIIISIIIVIFTWIIHELTHWITSEYLGYESLMRLNSVSLANEQEQTEWHKIYISASGPIITIFQAIIAFFILKKKRLEQIYLSYPIRSILYEVISWNNEFYKPK